MEDPVYEKVIYKWDSKYFATPDRLSKQGEVKVFQGATERHNYKWLPHWILEDDHLLLGWKGFRVFHGLFNFFKTEIAVYRK